jgi:hypothetical protein
MRFLRHAAVQRLFSAGLLLSLALWLAAPAVGATAPRTLDAEWPGPEVPSTVETAFEQVLADAASVGARTPEAFVAAFAEALDAQADPALAQFLKEHAPDAFLSVLYGQWVRAFSHHNGLEAAPAPPVAATAGAALTAAAPRDGPAATAPVYAAASLLATTAQGPVPLAELSSAQPLGP